MGLYIHIPYCEAKCHYCDFNSYAGREAEFDAMAEALYRDLERATRQLPPSFSRPLSTIFIGGGTPSVMAGRAVARLLHLARQRLGFAQNVEITSEANPGSLSREWLDIMLDAGLTRLSMGVQSLMDDELRQLGRVHTAETARAAVALARQSGVSSLSLDLIFGLPGQTLERWSSNLDAILALNSDHLSLYGLIIEDGTPFGRLAAQGRLQVPDDDTQADMYALACRKMAERGYQRYEISNFARNGHRCRHNEMYWRNGDYLGIGPGAVSYLDRWRFARVRRPTEYIRRIQDDQDVVAEGERLSEAAALAETVMLGLRTTDGVDLHALVGRYGQVVDGDALRESIFALASDLVDAELMCVDGGHLRVSAPGMWVSNGIMERFLALPHDLTKRRANDTVNQTVQKDRSLRLVAP